MTNAPPPGIARYRARATTHAVALDDEVLIWDAAGVQLHRLNHSAALVWNALSQWRSCGEVVGALADTLGVETNGLHDDVDACIEELARAGLVERRVSS